MKIKKNKLMIALILILLIILSLIALLFFSKKENTKITLTFENRINTLKEFDTGGFFKMGWLQVQGTNIDLPILDPISSSNDIDYSFSWISPNYSKGENRKVILGHNIINVSSTPMLPDENNGMMNFEELMAFSYYDFAKENLYIQYTDEDSNDIYLIYAIGFYDYDYDQAESFSTKKETKKYIEKVRKNSIYDYNIDVNEEDEILTLKNCTRYFGAYEKQQFFIDARKLRKNEKIIKYKVNKNKNYDVLIKNNEKNVQNG